MNRSHCLSLHLSARFLLLLFFFSLFFVNITQTFTLVYFQQQEAAAAAALSEQQQQQQQNPASPSTMPPQNYVQQLASALGLNSSTIAPSTDFESLIEMNRRQQQLNVSCEMNIFI